MSLLLKKKLRTTVGGLFLLYHYRKIKAWGTSTLYADETYLKRKYYKIFKKKPDLLHPSTFSEKLIWLNLYYRNENQIKCADKYAVRSYYKEVLGTDKYLIHLVGVFENIDEINLDYFPEKFVLKSTHGSGQNYICTNKSDLSSCEKKVILTECKYWLKENWYNFGREWHYKTIKPRIICEVYLGDEKGNVPFDYKIFCFNGEPRMIAVDVDRFTDHKIYYFDPHWELLNFTNRRYKISDKKILRPDCLEEMLDIARKLSTNFPHVRIDLFYVNQHIYCGEMTFFTAACLTGYNPEKYNTIVGDWLQLPDLNV